MATKGQIIFVHTENKLAIINVQDVHHSYVVIFSNTFYHIPFSDLK